MKMLEWKRTPCVPKTVSYDRAGALLFMGSRLSVMLFFSFLHTPTNFGHVDFPDVFVFFVPSDVCGKSLPHFDSDKHPPTLR